MMANSILDIPNELLRLILSNLDIADQACLALTCWASYHRVGPLVLDHPRLKSVQYASYYLAIATTCARIEFLWRLEKDHHKHWLYCAACFTLHPRSEFADCTYQDNVDYNISYNNKSCTTRGSRIVELCPCIQLTFRQKVRLISYLKALRSRNEDDSIIMRGPGRLLRQAFKVDVEGPGRDELEEQTTRYLSHECSILDDALGIIKIKVNAHLGDEDHLLVRTQYEIPGSSSGSSPRKSGPLQYTRDTCFIIRFKRQGGFVYRNFYGSLDPYTRARDLGGSAWPPDHTWDAQCADPTSLQALP
ncbi:hypothetical protein V8E54_011289 [Elaphomyces granulatus]